MDGDGDAVAEQRDLRSFHKIVAHGPSRAAREPRPRLAMPLGPIRRGGHSRPPRSPRVGCRGSRYRHPATHTADGVLPGCRSVPSGFCPGGAASSVRRVCRPRTRPPHALAAPDPDPGPSTTTTTGARIGAAARPADRTCTHPQTSPRVAAGHSLGHRRPGCRIRTAAAPAGPAAARRVNTTVRCPAASIRQLPSRLCSATVTACRPPQAHRPIRYHGVAATINPEDWTTADPQSSNVEPPPTRTQRSRRGSSPGNTNTQPARGPGSRSRVRCGHQRSRHSGSI